MKRGRYEGRPKIIARPEAVTFTAEADDVDKLRELSRETKVSQAEILRQALRKFLEDQPAASV